MKSSLIKVGREYAVRFGLRNPACQRAVVVSRGRQPREWVVRQQEGAEREVVVHARQIERTWPAHIERQAELRRLREGGQ